jgi:hypothetical protein
VLRETKLFARPVVILTQPTQLRQNPSINRLGHVLLKAMMVAREEKAGVGPVVCDEFIHPNW